MSIKQWPEAERPREKLMHQGAHALSDAELLAIFLEPALRYQCGGDWRASAPSIWWPATIAVCIRKFCQGFGLGMLNNHPAAGCIEMSRSIYKSS